MHQRKGITFRIVMVTALLVTTSANAGIVREFIDATGDGTNPLGFPYGIAVDLDGNVYLAGNASNNVFRFEPSCPPELGVLSQIIDATGDGVNGLLHPAGVAVDDLGNVYVAGQDSSNVFKITPGGTITQLIESSGDGLGNGLLTPTGIAVDASGNVFVSARHPVRNNVFRITPAGVITLVLGPSGDGNGNTLLQPQGTAVDPMGNLYVAGFESHNVFKVTPGGAITEIIDATGDGVHPLTFPQSIAADANGNLYVVGGNSAFKVTPGGVITEIIDSTGDGAGNTFMSGTGIAVDSQGVVFVNEGVSDSVFRIMPNGTITQILTGIGDGENLFQNPAALSIAVAQNGNVYVTGFASDNAFEISTDTCPEPILRAHPPHDILKNRYISIDPRGELLNNPPNLHIRVMVDSSQVSGLVGSGPWWANDPVNGGGLSPAVCVSVVTTTKPASEPDWSGCSVVHLTGCPIVPTTTYSIVAEMSDGGTSSAVLLDTQAKPGVKWTGDCVGFFDGAVWTPPNAVTSIDDAVAAIKTFQDPNALNATHLSVTDMVPNLSGTQINLIVNIADVFDIILGFQGNEYPGLDLTQCD